MPSSSHFETGPSQTVAQALVPNVTYFSDNRTFCVDCGADPPVRGRRPRRPFADRTRLIGLGEQRVQGDPRGPGGPPHNLCSIPSSGKTKRHWALVPAASRLIGTRVETSLDPAA